MYRIFQNGALLVKEFPFKFRAVYVAWSCLSQCETIIKLNCILNVIKLTNYSRNHLKVLMIRSIFIVAFRISVFRLFNDGYKFNNTPRWDYSHIQRQLRRIKIFLKREIEQANKRLGVFAIAIHLLLHSVLDLIKLVWIERRERPR